MKCFPKLLLLLFAAAVLTVSGRAQDAPDVVAVAVEEVVEAVADETPQHASMEAFAESAAYPLFTANNLWMMLCAGLVFIMHLGFACVESGLTRAKNTVNILFKNTLIPCIGLLTYAVVGFNLMYPGEDFAGKWFGFGGFGVTVTDPLAQLTNTYNAGYTYWTDFLFQAMFAATAATIVSGAVAERIKLGPFLIFSTLFVAISYPITGMWKWGGGWLQAMETPFYDFAGSTLVHSVGGWGALAGSIILGPRLGKYLKGGKMNALPGHSMPLATIGVFLLWLGWFGFNGGSVLSADPALVSLTLVTTCLAAAAGGLSAALTSWMALKKPDLSMALNGILAGLVGITAGADQMAALSAALIGLIAGVIVVFSVIFFDKIKIDDPVGAISVHLVCGIFGTLAVGMFGELAGPKQFMSQLIGVVAIGAFTFIFAYVLFLIVKAIFGLRVSEEEEVGGLDLGEHGCHAYPDFQGMGEN
ncbi:MAG: ammonium transporter [Verrucomicrobiae bacterium]|nr:ammonium transporter [Verrucomicrobiae bacterium]